MAARSPHSEGREEALIFGSNPDQLAHLVDARHLACLDDLVQPRSGRAFTDLACWSEDDPDARDSSFVARVVRDRGSRRRDRRGGAAVLESYTPTVICPDIGLPGSGRVRSSGASGPLIPGRTASPATPHRLRPPARRPDRALVAGFNVHHEAGRALRPGAHRPRAHRTPGLIARA